MTNNEYISMLVCWNQQGRLINLKPDDDLNTIEKSIINIYQLQQSNIFNKYQIQYYDENYQTFIDLCSETIPLFRQLLQRLQSRNTSLKSEPIWHLKMVPKTIETINDTFRSSTDVDTSNYQREIITTVKNIQINDITFSSQSVTDTKDLHEVATPQIVNEDQQGTNRFVGHESSQQVNKFNSNNPLNLHFEYDIADRQRSQYESDIERKGRRKSNSSSIGGVLLRASKLNGSVAYPTIRFQIPKNESNLSWSLHLYILTECDSDGNYYLHASKGIYDHITMTTERFGPIPNSKLVNPCVVELSQTDIQEGKYEIRLRICNIGHLRTHRQDKLRKFPELNRFLIYEDADLISEFTSINLNFSNESYHLGCILRCKNIVQDRCISKLTIDDNKRKQKDNVMQIKKKKL